MRRKDKSLAMLKANILFEQRHLESKGLIKEDRDTELRNRQTVIDNLISKSNELLESNPVKVYSGWALNTIKNPNSEEKYRKTADKMVNNPDVVSEVKRIRPVVGMDTEGEKRDMFGPIVVFKFDYGEKYIEVTSKGVKNTLLSTNSDGSPNDFIELDGLNTLYSIMNMAVDASSDYTDNEKSNLMYYLSVHLRKFVKK
tara:strand:+ start:106 stop:702 length:597 start_codon:yes stop_codon:yes gene_type:complete